MGKVLPVIVALVLLVYAFFDLYATPRTNVRHLPKWAWFAVVLVPVVGPLLWLFTGSRPSDPQPPDASPHRGGAVGPDDDPDFLRGL